MSDPLAESFTHCQQLARRAASSFYLSFFLLPRAERQAMCALYAFLRRTDDLGDSHAPLPLRRQQLADWRRSLERAMAGQFDDPLLPALAATLARFGIRPRLLHEVIDGVEQDLDRSRIATFAELDQYCYRVAGTVGLACIRIWGCDDPQAEPLAIECGLAFQLTNILRDLKEDAARDRVYLPAEELARFDYSADELKAGVRDRRFSRLMQFQLDRADACYQRAAPLEALLPAPGRRTLRMMTATYRGLLDEIRRRDGDVFTRPVRFGRWRKLRLAMGGLCSCLRLPSPGRPIEARSS